MCLHGQARSEMDLRTFERQLWIYKFRQIKTDWIYFCKSMCKTSLCDISVVDQIDMETVPLQVCLTRQVSSVQDLSIMPLRHDNSLLAKSGTLWTVPFHYGDGESTGLFTKLRLMSQISRVQFRWSVSNPNKTEVY